MKKVNIELSPHDALAILSFLREYDEELNELPQCESLRTAINNYEQEVYKMSDDQFNDGVAETRVYQLIGKAPSINKNGEDALE